MKKIEDSAVLSGLFCAVILFIAVSLLVGVAYLGACFMMLEWITFEWGLVFGGARLLLLISVGVGVNVVIRST